MPSINKKKSQRFSEDEFWRRKSVASGLRIGRERDKRLFAKDTGWDVCNSKVKRIEKVLHFSIRKEITAAKIEIGNERKVRLLDLGCLEGNAITEIANSFPNVEAHGISLVRNKKWQKSNVSWHVGHSEKTRLPSDYFDRVFSYFGITFSRNNMEQALKELCRILRKGGKAIINIQAGDLYRYIPPKGPFDRNNPATFPVIERMIKKTGFRIEYPTKGPETETGYVTHVFHIIKK